MVKEKKDVKKIPYEPPRAVRLAETKEGRGFCTSGSGDADACFTGSTAVGGCGAGNSF